jgi:hypothetical protein
VVAVEELENHMVDSEADPDGSELFDVLVGLTVGEAIATGRSTEKKNGCLAWMRLHERFNPTCRPRPCP